MKNVGQGNHGHTLLLHDGTKDRTSIEAMGEIESQAATAITDLERGAALSPDHVETIA